MFASTVGLISVIHLLSTTAERFSKGKYYKGNPEAKREDWYCFFKPSDLWGTDVIDKAETKRSTITDGERLEQRRRQQANRPRLQA
jgi:hypothetical protein